MLKIWIAYHTSYGVKVKPVKFRIVVIQIKQLS